MKRKKTAIEVCLMFRQGETAKLARKELRALLKAAKLLECWAFARGSERTPQWTARVLARLRRLGVLPEVRRG